MKRKEEWTLVGALVAATATVATTGAIADPSPAPYTVESPTPTSSCYYEQANTATPNGPITGGYKPCSVPQSVEEEERERQFVDRQERLRQQAEQDKRAREEQWQDVRRERLERERTGRSPGGPVTVPPPGTLSPS